MCPLPQRFSELLNILLGSERERGRVCVWGGGGGFLSLVVNPAQQTPNQEATQS